MTTKPYDHESHYAGARALRTFEHLGETFTVVRWRDHRGKHWRGYMALLHDGQWVGDDITRNRSDAEDPYEAQMARIFKTRESLLAALAETKARGTSSKTTLNPEARP